MPSNSVSPTIGSNENVAGSKMAIATAGPTPGSAPMMTPPTEPIISATRTLPLSENNQAGNYRIHYYLTNKLARKHELLQAGFHRFFQLEY